MSTLPLIGSVWRDNDPRMQAHYCQPRLVKVVVVYPLTGRVLIECNGRRTETNGSRFGKRSRIGFTLVSEAPLSEGVSKP